MKMPLKYRKCDTSHLSVLVQIARDTFVTAFEKDNDPDDFQEYIQKAFHPDVMLRELQNKNSFFFLVYESVELIGYIKLNVGEAQTDVHDPNALEIERIYVLDKHQGKNFGKQMLHRVVDLARKMGKHYIWLGVWEHNPGAIRFYQRNGFKKFGEHAYRIGGDEQTDFLLRLNIK